MMKEQIISEIFKLIVKLIREIFLKKKEEKTFVEKSIEQSNQINLHLSFIANNYNLKKVAINLFHNGTVTFNRIHLLKMSRLFSSSNLFEYNLQNVPLIPFYNLLLKMLNAGFLRVTEADNTIITPYFSQMGVSSVYYLPLFSEKEVVGYVSFEVEDESNLKENFTIDNLKREAIFLESLLNNKD